MQAITLRQPWAGLVVSGIKTIENRSWPTRLRGPLLIHAGLGSEAYAGDTPECSNINGAIIGVVEVVACSREGQGEWAEEGAWHWELARARLLPQPIEARGRLGLWNADGVIREHPELGEWLGGIMGAGQRVL